MTLPDIKFQANFTEKPLAGKKRASDDSVMLDVNVGQQVLPDGAATAENQDDLLTELQLKADLTETQPVSNTVLTSAVDGATTALKIIDYAHHEAHAGSHFTYISTQELTNAQVVSFVVVTPNTTKWAHFGFLLSGAAEFSLDVYEAATPTANGTLVSAPAVINNDRNSGTVHTTHIYHTPTLGGGSKGTIIKKWHGGAGKKVGGQAGTAQEIILRQGTKYWFEITNMTASNNFVDWVVEWYEHTNK